MALGVFVERREHDGKDCLHIVAHEVAEILVVPEVQSPFGDLEVINKLEGHTVWK